MSVSAVIPVWNGRELLARLLDSLDRQTERLREIILVDNGSTDGAPELGRSRGARVIAMGRNAGFAAAVNRGIREAAGEWIAVLNTDVELAPDYLALLVKAGAWFASGKILSAASPALVDGTFDVLCRGGVAWRAGSGCPDGPAFSQAQPICSPPWTAALFRANLFDRTGLLEERFESYYEDVDFGVRCATLGLQGRYVPDAVAWHRGSAALGRWHPDVVRHIARNQVYLVARHFPRSLRRRWMWPIVVAHLLWGAVAFRHGAGLAWMRGKWQGIREARRFPAPAEQNGKALELLCGAGEKTLRCAPGFFWWLYFRLTRGGAK